MLRSPSRAHPHVHCMFIGFIDQLFGEAEVTIRYLTFAIIRISRFQSQQVIMKLLLIRVTQYLLGWMGQVYYPGPFMFSCP